jgi:hypothetical protein
MTDTLWTRRRAAQLPLIALLTSGEEVAAAAIPTSKGGSMTTPPAPHRSPFADTRRRSRITPIMCCSAMLKRQCGSVELLRWFDRVSERPVRRCAKQVSALRKSLSDVLAKLDERSLSKLVRDYKTGMLPIRLRTPGS